MAAISADDIDRAIVTLCYEVGERRTSQGVVRVQRQLPWAFVQFPDSGDPRYVATVNGDGSVGLHASMREPYILGYEYMRNAAFPHEADFGPPDTGDSAKGGPRAVHFFATGGI